MSDCNFYLGHEGLAKGRLRAGRRAGRSRHGRGLRRSRRLLRVGWSGRRSRGRLRSSSGAKRRLVLSLAHELRLKLGRRGSVRSGIGHRSRNVALRVRERGSSSGSSSGSSGSGGRHGARRLAWHRHHSGVRGRAERRRAGRVGTRAEERRERSPVRKSTWMRRDQTTQRSTSTPMPFGRVVRVRHPSEGRMLLLRLR